MKQDAIDLMLGNYRPDSSGPSPFTPRTGQESLSNNVTKVFVLLMIIFSTLLLVFPLAPISSLASSSSSIFVISESNKLSTSMLLSVTITSVVVMYIMYNVVKVGSKIGKKIVVHPQLIIEAPPL